MRNLQKLPSCLVLFLLLLLAQPPETARAAGGSSDQSSKASLLVLNYLTGWSLDTAGYHPSVYLLLENVSGRDLSGVPIKLQGRFIDVHTAETSIAKMEIRRSLKPLQQFRLAVVAPRGYELPRETAYWPMLESKVMIRVGNVGDEGTETLIVANIDSTTQTQDDAFQKLNELTSFNRRSPVRAVQQKPSHAVKPQEPEKPLVATPMRAVPPGSQSEGDSLKELLKQKNLPGLGDDFYEFEKNFGLPTVTDSHRKEFTWARYLHRASGSNIVVCSSGVSGKADMIILEIPRRQFESEEQAFHQARAFAGKLKGHSLGKPTRSVRYLSSGRLEVSTSQSTGYRMVCMTTPVNGAGEGSYILILTRLPQEASGLLLEHAKDNPALKGLPVIRQ